ncbi:hypothetical protein MPTK1_6g05350 [Marchantia polymorpha subsp. ruderalis]|uniref:Uncharacterized protein n=2 Tax=Marchantia polymorpha TaxID=3197 RepID=A0AAF6BNS2_MARPO|nr:hypothetical protein MARPO_0167s0018 [Marchantia polymorpha]BBN13656.1 hypothetical protein Mp_6g05350 [Marchantia polymorpha subsp. ruderalis]|eukprot:PTQ28326.1 hypothetical protein MARPO_0167s0018 [Marchantia polymorpha]
MTLVRQWLRNHHEDSTRLPLVDIAEFVDKSIQSASAQCWVRHEASGAPIGVPTHHAGRFSGSILSHERHVNSSLALPTGGCSTTRSFAEISWPH